MNTNILKIMNQEELFKPDPTEPIIDICKLPEGEIDELQPFESHPLEYKRITPQAYEGSGTNAHLDEMGFLNANKQHTGEEVMNSKGMYIAGIDPYKELINDGSYAVLLKEGEGEDKGKLIAEYLGRTNKGNKWEVQFPELIKQLQFYKTDMLVEKTDEDFRTELKAIAMFKPEVFKRFLKLDYKRIINKSME